MVFGEEIGNIKEQNAKLEVEISENIRRYKACLTKMEQTVSAQDDPIERLRSRINDLDKRIAILSKPRPKIGGSSSISRASRPYSKISYK